MRFAGLIIAGWAALAGAGCVSVPERRMSAPVQGCQMGEPMVETMLFLGMARPGGTVSRYEFNQFVETEVVPRWKEGFTLLEGNGLWLSEERHVTEREGSRTLICIHGGGAADSAGIEAIRDAYRKAFNQDAVLRTDHQTCVDF